MVESILDFFRNLPPKQCAECGKVMEEQCESYTTVCEDCSSKIKK